MIQEEAGGGGFRGMVGLGPLPSQAGGLRDRGLRRVEWVEPEKQSLSQALDPWWQLFPAWEFAGSQMGSIPAEGPRSVLNEEGAFLGRDPPRQWSAPGTSILHRLQFLFL